MPPSIAASRRSVRVAARGSGDRCARAADGSMTSRRSQVDGAPISSRADPRRARRAAIWTPSRACSAASRRRRPRRARLSSRRRRSAFRPPTCACAASSCRRTASTPCARASAASGCAASPTSASTRRSATTTRSVETHLLDFDGDLYGRRLEVGFVARLRGEQKFPDVAGAAGADPRRHRRGAALLRRA